jgi:D-alanyl-D-alanine endopeptidase (penicillin-binding protein 7)
LLKRSLFIFSFILLLMLVARFEWANWFRKMGFTSMIRPGGAKELPLKNVYLSKNILESYKVKVGSEAAVVVDTKKGEVLLEKNMEKQLPIASLSKLMSVLVFLESKTPLSDSVTITREDAKKSGFADLRVGEKFTCDDLLHACLMSSSNRAARALARASGLTPPNFVKRMNRKAKELGLKKTVFYEPTGLSEENKSTALDCAKLLYFALQDSIIASISEKTTHRFVSLDRSRTAHQIRSTNRLLFGTKNVKGGKTGYNGVSGWCLGVMVEDTSGKEVVAVVLGAPDKRTRYKDIRTMVEWCMQTDKETIRKS